MALRTMLLAVALVMTAACTGSGSRQLESTTTTTVQPAVLPAAATSSTTSLPPPPLAGVVVIADCGPGFHNPADRTDICVPDY